MDLVLLFLVVTSAFFVQTTLGFGAALVTVALGALVIPLSLLLPVFVPLGIANAGYIVWSEREHINWAMLLKRIMPLMAIGFPFGMLLFRVAPEDLMKGLFGVGVAILSVIELVRIARTTEADEPPRPPTRMERFQRAAALIGGGITQGAWMTGGPLVVYAAGHELKDKHSFRATLCTLWAVTQTMLAISFLFAGDIRLDTLQMSGTLSPAVPLGLFLGNRAHAALNGSAFKALVYGLLMIAGLMLARSLFGWLDKCSVIGFERVDGGRLEGLGGGAVLLDTMNRALIEWMSAPGVDAREGVALGVPEEFRLPRERARMFFARLGLGEVAEERLEGLGELAQEVAASWEGQRRETLWIEVGDAMFKSWNPAGMLKVLRCNRCWHDPLACRHVLALYLALGFRTPEAREVMLGSLWELQLLARLPSEEGAAGEASDEEAQHDGWIRYIIHAPSGEDAVAFNAPDYRALVEREVVRLGRRDGRELKPQALGSRSVDEVAQRVRGVTEADREVERALERLGSLYAMLRNTYGAERYEAARSLVDHAATDALMSLARVRDVRLGERAVRIVTKPLRPEIHVGADEDAAATVRLTWQPPVEELLDVGRGFVLDATGALRPLDASVPPSMKPLMMEPLPSVPVKEVERFVERFVVRSPVPVRLRRSSAWGSRRLGRFERQVLLSEEEDELLVTPRFGYTAGEWVSEVEVGDPSSLVVVRDGEGEPQLVERDEEAEGEALGALLAAAGLEVGRWPLRLRGVEAYDFLEEALPGLVEQGWVVFGGSRLRAHRVRAMKPSVSMSSGTDWFDLKVEFNADEVQVSVDEVIAAWVSGRRYHRLRDGSVARLPEQWLERHGQALIELRDVRRAASGRLGAWAAPMAQGLMEASEGGEGRATWRRLAELLTSFEAIPEVEPCVPVEATLRAYQRDGVRWLSFLRDTGLGGVLADDMGLGKTLQVLVTLADTHGAASGMVSLVVAPVSVLYNWAAEARRFVPSLKTYVHHGRDRQEVIPPGTDVIITSYALLRLELERFSQTRYRYVVLDEAQHIKNARSQVAQAARRLRVEHRLALSGTPLENNLHDLWSLFQFVMPGFFGSEASFRRRYARPIQLDGDEEALARLKARIRPFVLRRLKRDVAIELPPRQEQILYCDLGPDQRRLYEQIRATWRSVVLDEVEEKGVGGATLTVLEALTRLRQTCCDARLVPLDEARGVEGSAKIEQLLELVDEMIAGGHRALVFSQWPTLLKLVRAELEARGIGHLYLDGQTRGRQELVEAWNAADGPPVFLISLKAGGSGMNLTGADCVVHLDPWWNPAVEAQATARAHRIGQTRSVNSYKLVARGTVEEKLLELQQRKLQLMESALDADQTLVEQLTREDLEAVFALEGE